MYNEHILHEFEFDPVKEARNLKKHGIDFETAKEVFVDPDVVGSPDRHHSWKEERWYAVGRISDGSVVTVWYTLRNGRIRIIGAGRLRKGREEYEKRKISGL